MRRIAALLLLAAGPVLVLGVLFVLPVTGMVAEGFVVDGRFAPGAVLDVLARPRVHRVAWFTVWTSGVATLLAVALGHHARHRQDEERAEHQHRPRSQEEQGGDAPHREMTSVHSVSHCSRLAAISSGATS